jgi:hypothetical protein
MTASHTARGIHLRIALSDATRGTMLAMSGVKGITDGGEAKALGASTPVKQRKPHRQIISSPSLAIHINDG